MDVETTLIGWEEEVLPPLGIVIFVGLTILRFVVEALVVVDLVVLISGCFVLLTTGFCVVFTGFVEHLIGQKHRTISPIMSEKQSDL